MRALSFVFLLIAPIALAACGSPDGDGDTLAPPLASSDAVATSPAPTQAHTLAATTPAPTATAGWTVPGAPVRVDRGPYLQATTRTSTTIVWRTVEVSDSVVEYGDATATSLTSVGDATAREREHVVTIGGLLPAKTYHYRISTSGQPATTFATFATAPAPGATFTFLAFGDSGAGNQKQREVAATIAREPFDLAIHTGDVIYPSGQASGYDPYFFKPYGVWLRERPIFPAIGNHDYVTASGGPYLDVFKVPANNPQRSGLYYSFEWGDAKFVSLDTHRTFQRSSGPHMDWLRNELLSSTHRWKIVFMHIPLYSSGEHGSDTSLIRDLQPLFEEARVDLVVQGHDHIYERTKPIKRHSSDPAYAGVTYIVTGGGGASRYHVRPHSWTAKAESTRHATFVTVSPGALEGRVIREDATLVERFAIRKP